MIKMESCWPGAPSRLLLKLVGLTTASLTLAIRVRLGTRIQRPRMTSAGQRATWRDWIAALWEGLGKGLGGDAGSRSFLSSLLSQTGFPPNKNDPVGHHKQSEKHASRQSETIQRCQDVLFQPLRLLDPRTQAESAVKTGRNKCLRKEEGMKARGSHFPQSFCFTVTTCHRPCQQCR